MGRPLPLPLAKPSSALCLRRGEERTGSVAPRANGRNISSLGAPWVTAPGPGTAPRCSRRCGASFRTRPRALRPPLSALLCHRFDPTSPKPPETGQGARLGLVAKAPRTPHLALGLNLQQDPSLSLGFLGNWVSPSPSQLLSFGLGHQAGPQPRLSPSSPLSALRTGARPALTKS